MFTTNHKPLRISGIRLLRGFYYHKNHEPNGTVNNYAYELITVNHDSTDQCLHSGWEETVSYRPLYPHLELPLGDCFSQPLEKFVEDVNHGGIMIPRFRHIIDPDVIDQLKKIRKEMYDE